ncbi:hypothetical protein ABMA27_001417 [Loxostege sticticalis]|uniref:Fatty acid desaturase domain-containing protein n=1 Tax=Loxostege sticticalis TaxID=481309 RepID=A0ABR3HYF4_LOXSC
MAAFDIQSEVSDKLQAPQEVCCEANGKSYLKICTQYIGTDYSYKHQIVWKNAIGFLILHLLTLWGVYIVVTGGIQFRTYVWSLLVMYLSGLGVTIGAHRLYTHKSFKASSTLRAALIILQTITGQNSMFIWCRDHRLHHRYSDTDADPHNAKRGLFFSHMGWLMTKKHLYVIELGRKIDMSDLQADWMVMFQKKYYYQLYILFAIMIPVVVPVYYFDEPWLESFLVAYMARYILLLHVTWTVNSLAHLYGTRPFNKNLQPVESWFVAFIAQGEGWQNYHHAFPWDYKAAELSTHLNASAIYIEFFEKIGLATDLKKASPELIRNRIKSSGDGTHFEFGTDEGRSAVKALGPLHPLNPSYTSTLPDPEVTLRIKGLLLYHEKDILNCNSVTVRRNVGSPK